ncbi:MAG: alpha/beta fold hydrolase [Sneathiella sp.]|nr:alpha/beta fold hydrolase [Sneathiella sp.]
MSGQPDQMRRRIGPRPLGLHLGLASATLTSSLGALPLAKRGHYPWLPELKSEAKNIQEQLQDFEIEAFLPELAQRGQTLVSEMMSGIEKYHSHPYKRKETQSSIFWSRGAAQLLDYGKGVAAGAPIALIVPSLINRAYILDLKAGRSFVDGLAEAGIHPYLLDWGAPGAEEREYFLDDYFNKILFPALNYLAEANPSSPIHLLGYCMGGTLAVAQASIQQGKISSLIALASPWNFHDGLNSGARFMISQKETWDSVLKGFGEMPVDLLQTFFASLDPNLCLNKFRMFNNLSMDSVRAEEFVALEDWLNDGIPLVKNVAAECFKGWYGENSPYLGSWHINGDVVRPQSLTIPTLIAVPASDRIVPPGSALGLAEQIPNAKVINPPSGHIGMVAGSRAKTGLWQDVIDWIKR